MVALALRLEQPQWEIVWDGSIAGVSVNSTAGGRVGAGDVVVTVGEAGKVVADGRAKAGAVVVTVGEATGEPVVESRSGTGGAVVLVGEAEISGVDSSAGTGAAVLTAWSSHRWCCSSDTANRANFIWSRRR